MKLNRFLTEEEKQKLLELFTHEELKGDGKSYYHCENMKDDKNVKYINGLLKEVIKGFTSFTRFVNKKDGSPSIRLQYNYGAMDDSMHFIGVGYITIKELNEGFVVEENGGI